MSGWLSDEMKNAGPDADPAATMDDRGQRLQESDVAGILRGSRMVLMGNRLCPFAHRAWWFLNELGVQNNYKYLHVDLGPAKPDFYPAQLNPSGAVPCLYDGPVFVPESMVVVEYLAKRYNRQDFFGQTAKEVRAVRLMLSMLDVGKFYQVLSCRDPAALPQKQAALETMLDKLETLYSEEAPSGGPFLLGDRLSAAEIAFVPFLERMVPSITHYRSVDVLPRGSFPRLSQAWDAVRGRAAWKATTCDPAFFVDVYRLYAEGDRAGSLPPSAFARTVSKRPLGSVAATLAVGVAAGLALGALSRR